MENNEEKFRCPYCGYEMNKGTNRCENCAGIIDNANKTDQDISSDNTVYRERINEVPENTQVQAEDAASNTESVDQNINNTAQTYVDYESIKLVPPPLKPLSNAIKVALTAVCVMLPVIGQFAGLILSIIYMNSDDDLKDSEDRRSFGLALLIACVIAFVVNIFWGFVMLITAARSM